MLGILSGIGAGINLLGGISKAISGSKRERSIKNAIENYERQDLRNVFSSIGVSSLGADLLREENARVSATSIDALQSAGARGVVGGLGSVLRQSNLVNREAAADLDRQQQDINRLRANDDARIRSMQERREEEDLRGLGTELNAARQDKYSGIGDIGSSVMSLGALGGDGMLSKLLNPAGGKVAGAITNPVNLDMQGMGGLQMPSLQGRVFNPGIPS